MGGFPLLDLVIGLCFVYLLLALICSTVTEWVAHYRGSRGAMLREGVKALLQEQDDSTPALTNAVFAHPLVVGLNGQRELPSYIASSVFAKALRHAVRTVAPGGAELASNVPRLSPGLRKVFSALSSGGPTARVAGGSEDADLPSESALADWFDRAMDRLTGVYRRRARVVNFWVAVVITVLLNVDTFALTNMLWQNATLRNTLVEQAKVRLAQGAPLQAVEYTEPDEPRVTPVDTTAVSQQRSSDHLTADEMALMGQFFGWKTGLGEFVRRGGDAVAWTLLGWLITALAVSLGAPFWFDTLNRFMSVRSAGAVPPARNAEPAK